MSSALTETAANANFAVGLQAPDVGVDFTAECNSVRSGLQQLADRTQRLRQGVAGGDTQTIRVPLINLVDEGTPRFAWTLSSDRVWAEQTSVASVGQLYFSIPYLVTGRKITAATAYWQNSSNTTLPITTMPTLILQKVDVSTGTASPNDVAVASQADTTAVVATYQAMHKITLSCSETILEDTIYYLEFDGENGTNAVAGGRLWHLSVTMGI